MEAPRTAPVFLSVVIPVYNESARIPQTVSQVLAYLRGRPERCELVVVDDGSTDGSADLIAAICRDFPDARLLRHERNHGKGCAVRHGMLAAQGEYLLFSDADLSAPIEEAARLLEPMPRGYDVVIGSRALRRDWIQVHQSRRRELAGSLFNWWLRLVTGLPFRDTQCGFKAFRREAARRLFALQTLDGFGFDAEILYLARKFGYRTLEVPVHWSHAEGTKIRLLRDGLRMAGDLLRIRWNDFRGRYAAAPEDGAAK
ncbi:MAG TPA: dolichyl-phosphate beta-glucosyltransferase [Terriglobia bacterium]|nr:dolichyl-phosphate beta-glucosyltransferase [Terriglobia bacterium]